MGQFFYDVVIGKNIPKIFLSDPKIFEKYLREYFGVAGGEGCEGFEGHFHPPREKCQGDILGYTAGGDPQNPHNPHPCFTASNAYRLPWARLPFTSSMRIPLWIRPHTDVSQLPIIFVLMMSPRGVPACCSSSSRS